MQSEKKDTEVLGYLAPLLNILKYAQNIITEESTQKTYLLKKYWKNKGSCQKLLSVFFPLRGTMNFGHNDFLLKGGGGGTPNFGKGKICQKMLILALFDPVPETKIQDTYP